MVRGCMNPCPKVDANITDDGQHGLCLLQTCRILAHNQSSIGNAGSGDHDDPGTGNTVELWWLAAFAKCLSGDSSSCIA